MDLKICNSYCGTNFAACSVNSAKSAEIFAHYWIHQASCERVERKPVGPSEEKERTERGRVNPAARDARWLLEMRERTHTYAGGDKPSRAEQYIFQAAAGRVVYTASASLIRVDLQLPTTPAVSVCLSPAALLDLPDISRAGVRRTVLLSRSLSSALSLGVASCSYSTGGTANPH